MKGTRNGTDNQPTHQEHPMSIATFTSYHTGDTTRTPVETIHIHVTGRAGAWGFHAAFRLAAPIFPSAADLWPLSGPGVPSDSFYRYLQAPTYRTKKLAIKAAQTFLEDHFGTIPQGAELSINRSTKFYRVPFPQRERAAA